MRAEVVGQWAAFVFILNVRCECEVDAGRAPSHTLAQHQAHQQPNAKGKGAESTASSKRAAPRERAHDHGCQCSLDHHTSTATSGKEYQNQPFGSFVKLVPVSSPTRPSRVSGLASDVQLETRYLVSNLLLSFVVLVVGALVFTSDRNCPEACSGRLTTIEVHHYWR